MLRTLLPAALAATALLCAAASASAADDPASLVDPLIGTANGGNVFPGADTPFGMVQFSPDETNGNQTANVNSSGYADGVNRIRGFGLAHVSGAGCGGLAGDVPFFPYTGDVATSPAADVKDATYSSRFATADQSAKAGSYSVKLDSGIKAELSATTRTAAGRFTYPASGKATMLVRTSAGLVGSSDADVTIDPATRTISGSVTSGNFCGNKNLDGNPDRTSYYTLYFVAKFDADFTSYGTWKDAAVNAGATSASGGTSYDGGSSGGVTSAGGLPTPGKGSGAYVQFTPGTQVGVRVGVSYVDAAGAQANLDAEQPAGTSFDSVVTKAHDAWNDQLNRIETQGGTASQQKVFYTALYHSLLHMNVFSDVDGRYRGMDQKIHTVAAPQHAQYATFSGWDIYRSQVQLVSLLDPSVASDMAQSLYNQSTQDVNGRWDRWTHNSGAVSVMSGDPSPSFVDTVLAFGGTNFDKTAALQSLVKAATVPTTEDLSHIGWMNTAKGQRPSLDQFLRLHYFPNPSNAWSGASETLEDATADFAIADLAQRLGDTATYDQFMTRAQYWQNIFHLTGAGFMQNRAADGTWPALDPANGGDFAEGSPTQYVWNIPFNVAGLFAAMGGPQTAADRLDAYFHNGANWAFTGAGGLHPELNNEPSLWAPWLFAWSGEPAKTQQVVRQIEDTLWTTATRGIPGNDDLGTMSSWYVFSAMGMYPVIPGRAELVLGSPLFSKVVIHRGSGQTLTINAPDAGKPYVSSLKLDGASYDKPWLPESFVAGDHTLDYSLADSATSWGENAPPPSFRAGEQPVIASLGATQSFQLDPGGTTKTALTLQNTTDAVQTVTLHPTGEHVTVTGGPFTVPAGGRTTADVTIGAPADTPLGTSELVDLGLTGAPKVVAKVTVDVPKPLASLRNNVGIVSDTHTAGPAFDSTGHSYSREALAAAGITPGAKVAIGGFEYTWPDVAAGADDNYLADGTRISLGDATGAIRIGLLGSAANGPSKTTATVTYSDGSTSQAPVSYGDWALGGGAQPSAGNRKVASMPRRTTSTGTENTAVNLFSDAIALTPGKTAVSLSIPAASSGFIHVFAIALDKRGPLPLAALRDQAGIARDAFHAEASLDWTGHAFSREALAAKGVVAGAQLGDYVWPDLAPASFDNMEVAGQEIALEPHADATKIGLLATAIKGPADTVATVAYTDGTYADTPLSVSDWTPGNLQAGNTLMFETTYRDTTGGTDTTHAAMYSVGVPVAAGKTAKWIRLTSPTTGSAAIHLFAIAQDGKPIVSTSAETQAGGTVPATLGLTLGAPASFGTFAPGVEKTYTASTTATIVSSAGDAALSVSDPGHLMNGTFAMPEPLQVDIVPAAWSAPVSNGTSAIAFTQRIGANDSLRTGSYSTTLTFTLSTTNP